MGSTVVALRQRDDGAEIGWVGDSRAYLLRDGGLRQLTRDHSLTQALTETLGRDAGVRDSRILLQAIGSTPSRKWFSSRYASAIYSCSPPTA